MISAKEAQTRISRWAEIGGAVTESIEETPSRNRYKLVKLWFYREQDVDLTPNVYPGFVRPLSQVLVETFIAAISDPKKKSKAPKRKTRRTVRIKSKK